MIRGVRRCSGFFYYCFCLLECEKHLNWLCYCGANGPSNCCEERSKFVKHIGLLRLVSAYCWYSLGLFCDGVGLRWLLVI